VPDLSGAFCTCVEPDHQYDVGHSRGLRDSRHDRTQRNLSSCLSTPPPSRRTWPASRLSPSRV